MLRATIAMLLLVTLLVTPGCIIGTITAAAIIYGKVAQQGKSVGMNYHADLPATWDAALAQLADMRLAPAGGQANLNKDRGTIAVNDFKATVTPLKKGQGTRIVVTADPENYVQLRRARDFLDGTAQRLGEFQEVVWEYDAALHPTWDAALAQLKAMDIKTGTGTRLDERGGRIRVEDVWATLEALPEGGTRIHIGFGAQTPERDIERARLFLEGVAKRLDD